MKLTKSKLREMIREMIAETEAEGYDDPAYRATVKQFKGKKASNEQMHTVFETIDPLKISDIIFHVEKPKTSAYKVEVSTASCCETRATRTKTGNFSIKVARAQSSCSGLSPGYSCWFYRGCPS